MKKILTIIGTAALSCNVLATDLYVEAGAAALHHSDFSDWSVRPALRVGVERKVNFDWNVGTSLELLTEGYSENHTQGSIITWRVAQFDYELTRNTNMGFFFGTSRYSREEAGWGMSYGFTGSYRMNDQFRFFIDATSTSTDISYQGDPDINPGKLDRFYWVTTGVRYTF